MLAARNYLQAGKGNRPPPPPPPPPQNPHNKNRKQSSVDMWQRVSVSDKRVSRLRFGRITSRYRPTTLFQGSSHWWNVQRKWTLSSRDRIIGTYHQFGKSSLARWFNVEEFQCCHRWPTDGHNLFLKQQSLADTLVIILWASLFEEGFRNWTSVWSLILKSLNIAATENP